MSKTVEELVRERIVLRHQGDEKQLEVIFSSDNRLLVEAPAGYGKTNTMVSKIAYMIATNQIPTPKKLLALTFSVNAAYKIKKDVGNQIPDLLKDTGLAISISDKIYVSNYHGFCRSILVKYGWIFHSSLTQIDSLQSIDDSDPRKTQELILGLEYDKSIFMSNYCLALKNSDVKFLKDNLNNYCDIIIADFIPAGYISYNSILTLSLKLLSTFPNVLKFYHKYFTTLLVDEYQDTNTLSYWLIKLLISDETRVILLGDSLQRIYGFIGAVNDLLSKSETEFELKKIILSKNYRFASNPQMLQLDYNIRKNAELPSNPSVFQNAIIKVAIYPNQIEECLQVLIKALELIQNDPTSKVAILVKQRGGNTEHIIKTFEHNNIPFFYGLFSDEDAVYIEFHKKCIFEFIELIKLKPQVSKKLSREHIQKIKDSYSGTASAIVTALLGLLEIFWNKLFLDFSNFSNEEKILLIKDSFELRGLKQYVEFIDSHIIISTVHGAKGLEWDYVIIPDMEQDSFPNWIGNLCNKGGCLHKSDCSIKVTQQNEKAFLEELSVFYVAVTRARKQVYFTASSLDIKGYSKNSSCFLKLPGIVIEDIV